MPTPGTRSCCSASTAGDASSSPPRACAAATCCGCAWCRSAPTPTGCRTPSPPCAKKPRRSRTELSFQGSTQEDSMRRPAIIAAAALCTALAQPLAAAVQTPEQFFGFKIGTNGELARYPKVVEYLQHLAANSDRVKFRELGRTTLDNAFVLATFSSPQNLRRFDDLVKINRRLADPRTLTEAEARKLSVEGR